MLAALPVCVPGRFCGMGFEGIEPLVTTSVFIDNGSTDRREEQSPKK